jgi:hypothetical protein
MDCRERNSDRQEDSWFPVPWKETLRWIRV